MNSLKISGLVLMGSFTVGIISGSIVRTTAGTDVVAGIAGKLQKNKLTELYDGKDSLNGGDNSDTETNVGDVSDESKEYNKDNRDDRAPSENDGKVRENNDKIGVGKASDENKKFDGNKLSSENKDKVKAVSGKKESVNTNTATVAGVIGSVLAFTGLGTTIACNVTKELGGSEKNNKDSQKQKKDEKKTKENNDNKNKTNPSPSIGKPEEKEESKSSFSPWYIVGPIIFAIVAVLLIILIKKYLKVKRENQAKNLEEKINKIQLVNHQ